MKLPTRDWLRHSCPAVIITVGAMLLLYVGMQYGRMYLEQRSLAREWQQQQHLGDSVGKAEGNRAEDLTRLAIPKIKLDAIVVEGTTRHDLFIGPGHIQSTAVPGETGNAVISGHRDTFFRHLHELSKGDLVTVQRSGNTYHYEVIGSKIVGSEDVSVIQPTKDKRLTLITCYPAYSIGPAPYRLVVLTKLHGQSELSAQARPPNRQSSVASHQSSVASLQSPAGRRRFVVSGHQSPVGRRP